jgi:hypothetical protein
MPIIAGSEINDDPYAPVSRLGRELVAEHGDDTAIEWVHRSRRYGEKLATPDTSIADLIGEVDPIKVAEGRYLSDELTLHYGLVPRTNRGIFAINELPDLAERIQVGLLNVLEERDIQVRGYKISLPLDLILFASANPEDYTNRGRIITPLKDRFGSQIRTHYPLEVETEVSIALAEAVPLEAEGVRVTVPDYMTEVVATLSHLARSSPHIDPLEFYHGLLGGARAPDHARADESVGSVVVQADGRVDVELQPRAWLEGEAVVDEHRGLPRPVLRRQLEEGAGPVRQGHGGDEGRGDDLLPPGALADPRDTHLGA